MLLYYTVGAEFDLVVGSTPGLNASLSDYNTDVTEFKKKRTYYDRPGLVLPWPHAITEPSCNGYFTSTNPCTPINVYGELSTPNIIAENSKKFYTIAPPEGNLPTTGFTGSNYLYTPLSPKLDSVCSGFPASSKDRACLVTGDRLSRSKANTLYFNLSQLKNYDPWPSYTHNQTLTTFPQVSLTAAPHNPMDTSKGTRDLTNITGFGYAPHTTGLSDKDYVFNFDLTDPQNYGKTIPATSEAQTKTNHYDTYSIVDSSPGASNANKKLYYYQGDTTAVSAIYARTYNSSDAPYTGGPTYYEPFCKVRYTKTGGQAYSGTCSSKNLTSSIITNNETTYSSAADSMANWYTYYRSASLASKAVAARSIDGLVQRGTNERFRIGFTLPNGEIIPPKKATTTWINELYNHIYNINGPISFYASNGEDHASKFFKTITPYLRDPSNPNSGTDSCRRNYEILIFPDMTTVYSGEKLGAGGTMTSALERYADIDSCSDLLGDGSRKCPQPDNYAGTFADMAMYGWITDLRSGEGNDMPNNILPSIKNPATWQHVVRYIVSPGGDQYGKVTPKNNSHTSPQNWYTPISTEYHPFFTADSLYHMALNSRGLYYHYQDIPEAIEKVAESFIDILTRNATGSAVATNTTAIATQGTIYQAALDNDWRGRLRAYKITVDSTSGTASIDASPLWDAAYILSAQTTSTKCLGVANCSTTNPAYTDSRRILTTKSNTREPIPFRYDELSSEQKRALAPNVIQSNITASAEYGIANSDTYDSVYGKYMLLYLRGNGACEENTTCPETKIYASDPPNNGHSISAPTQFRRRGLEIFSTSNESSRPALSASQPDGRDILGDIANSSPWYVGATLPGYSDVDYPGYNQHRLDHSTRKGVVYVGANDGMLHAIYSPECTTAAACASANAGKELFAYIPSFLFDNLRSLSVAGSTYSHKFFVDSSPFSAEAWVGGEDGEWKTVLVSGVGGGGKGYFALDVTTVPAVLTAAAADTGESALTSKVLWEFTDSDLGYTYNYPGINRATAQAKQIVRTKAGDSCNSNSANNKKRCKWAVIVGNGYDNTPGRQAALYVIFLDGPGGGGTWQSNNSHAGDGEYVKIPVGNIDYSGSGGYNTNGLSTPTPVDIDNDGFVDYVYAGDLNGNMWRFDFTGVDDSWTVTAAFGGTPLYTATTSYSNGLNTVNYRQPIIQPPEVTIEPSTGKPLVLFGTGQLLVSSDKTSSTPESFYAILDHRYNNNGSWTSISRTNLKQRTSEDSSVSVSGRDVNYRLMTDRSSFTFCGAQSSVATVGDTPYNPINPSTCPSYGYLLGWYWDMPWLPPTQAIPILPRPPSERMTGRPQLVGTDIRFNTYIPDSDACNYGGTGWEMCLTATTGIQACSKNGLSITDTTKRYSGLSLIGGEKIGAALGGVSYIPTQSGSYLKIYSPLGVTHEGTPQTSVVSDASNQGRVMWYELAD
ncbi:MAG: hypothetical protein HZB71_03600 [Betaproteobacteria bacterium]|nr:hypothetical protein [Betaproteobacteria bacterium]